jgi:hypothetical protein
MYLLRGVAALLGRISSLLRRIALLGRVAYKLKAIRECARKTPKTASGPC